MEDEKDLSVDNDDSSVQEVDNTDDADVNKPRIPVTIPQFL